MIIEQLISADTADLKYWPLIGHIVSNCALPLIFKRDEFQVCTQTDRLTHRQIDLIAC